MSEIAGVDIGAVGHAGVAFKEGNLVAEVFISGDKVVDLVINAAESAIPGDFDKPLLEVVRAAAKAALLKA